MEVVHIIYCDKSPNGSKCLSIPFPCYQHMDCSRQLVGLRCFQGPSDIAKSPRPERILCNARNIESFQESSKKKWKKLTKYLSFVQLRYSLPSLNFQALLSYYAK